MLDILLTNTKIEHIWNPVREVVRLHRDYSCEFPRGAIEHTKLQRIERYSYGGYSILQEEISQIGPKDFFSKIKNLEKCETGLYELVYTNISKDFETGYMDEWDYKLIPFNPEKDLIHTLMRKDQIKTEINLLDYILDCNLATVSHMASLKSRGKHEYERQINISQTMVDKLLDINPNHSFENSGRGQDVVFKFNKSVKDWAKQYEPMYK